MLKSFLSLRERKANCCRHQEGFVKKAFCKGTFRGWRHPARSTTEHLDGDPTQARPNGDAAATACGRTHLEFESLNGTKL